MNFKKVFISELSPAKYNPRKDLVSSDPEYQRIKRSIEEFGYVDPIIVNSDYTVIGGHQRLKVLKELGHAQIDVVVVDIPKNKEKALNVALNKISGDWDQARLAVLLEEIKLDGMLEFTGFDEKEFDQLLRELHKDDVPLDAEPQISRAEELRKEWGTELGQMWQCGEHRVIVGDCTDKAVVERVMGGGEQPMLMVTDPPYGVEYDPEWRAKAGINKNKGKMGVVQNDNIADWSPAWALFTGDVVYVWHAGKFASEVQQSLESSGFEIIAHIMWKKDRFALSRGDYHWQHEPSWYAVRKGTNHQWAGARDQSTVWDIARADDSGHGHGTQKPLECMSRPIQNHTSPVVYDPFLGSGTTMIACENLKRKCRGCEIDPGYVAVILQRYKDTFPDKEIRLIQDDKK